MDRIGIIAISVVGDMMEQEIERAVQRRNLDKVGDRVLLVNGQEPSRENVRQIVERAKKEKGGLDEMERHLRATKMRERRNTDAGIEEIRSYETVDSRVVTWDDVIQNTKAIIADRQQYIADVELAGEYYERYVQVYGG